MYSSKDKIGLVRLLFGTFLLFQILSASALDQSIAYLRLTEGYWQVWVTDSKGKEHRQLTFDASDKARISWSKDRKKMLCNSNDGAITEVTIKDGNNKILKLPFDNILDAQWSPTNKWMTFTITTTQATDNNDIWIMRSNGQSPKKLTNQPGVSQTPSWHPDGEKLIYSAMAPNESSELWVVDLKESKYEQLTVGKGYKYDPVYSPQGKLAYSSNAGGNFNIWLISEKNTAPEKIINSPAYDAQPSWSLDGEKIAFYSTRNNQRRIWVKDLSTNKIKAVTPEGVLSRYPVWYR